MKKLLFVVIIVFSIFLVGCEKKNVSPFENKERLHDLYFDVFSEASTSDKKAGTLDSGKDWESYSYTFDSMIITVTYYKDRNIDYELAYLGDIEEFKENGITYKYNEKKIDSDYKQEDYYTQIGNDTYLISAVYKDNVENKKTLDSFIDSVRSKE